jgi:hypothetical protein
MKGGRVTGVKAEGAESEGRISRGGVGGVDAEGAESIGRIYRPNFLRALPPLQVTSNDEPKKSAHNGQKQK